MPSTSPSSHHSRVDALQRLTPVLIVLAVIYAFSNACKGPFIFDDVVAIVDNPSIRTLWPIWTPMFPSGIVGTAGRPLVGLSYAINYAIGGLDPFGYHAGNVAIHALAALVLWGVLRRTLRRLAHPAADSIALAVTLIWTVHPLLTDTVTYIINRTEGLMSLFFLLTLYTFLRSLDSPHKRRWLVLSIVCNLAAVASKEVGAMAAPVLLLFDALIVSRSWKVLWQQRRWYYAGMLLGWILLPLLLATASAAVKSGGSRLTSWQYLMMQAQIIPMYVRLAFWPHPLVICYVDWPVPSSVMQVLPQMLLLGGAVAATIFLAMRGRPAAMYGVWFFLILAPSSSLLPLGTEPAAERRMYLPLIAIVLLVVGGFHSMFGRIKYLGGVLTVVAVIALGQVTLWRNEDYSSGMAIWSDTVAKRPNNPRANLNLGLELANAGDDQGALACFDKAIAAAPQFTDAHTDRGVCLIHLGRLDEGIAALQAALRNDPANTLAWTKLGAALQLAGHAAEGKQSLEQAIKLDPDNEEAKQYLKTPATQSLQSGAADRSETQPK